MNLRRPYTKKNSNNIIEQEVGTQPLVSSPVRRSVQISSIINNPSNPSNHKESIRLDKSLKTGDGPKGPISEPKSSKLSSMRSPFYGVKRKKQADPLQEQIDELKGGWKPSKSIAPIPKSLMKMPPPVTLLKKQKQLSADSTAFSVTPPNILANKATSPSTPMTPTPKIPKPTRRTTEAEIQSAIDDRKVSSKWARHNANKGHIPSGAGTSPVFNLRPAISSKPFLRKQVRYWICQNKMRKLTRRSKMLTGNSNLILRAFQRLMRCSNIFERQTNRNI